MRHARRDLHVALIAAALLLAWDATPLDLWLAQALGTTDGFFWQEHWLTQGLFHDGARRVGGLMLVLLGVNLVRPLWPGLGGRERLRWLLVTLAALGVVTLIKRSSATSCPWDLQLFGGVAEHLSHWRWGSSDGGPGGCFPSGHAATSFAFMSGWFAWRDTNPAAARRWLFAALGLGALLGVAQVLRGAHFASHVGWSAWACWVVGAIGSARTRLVPALPPAPILPAQAD